MVRYNVMHAIPIFNKESLEYLREEKNGYITIILKNHPELRELIINPTAVEILKKCDGENTMEDIHNYLCDKYDSIDSKQIANDVLQVLSNFTKVGLISWKGEKNPFMSIYEEMLDGIRLRIAEETDIKSIIKMVEVIKSKKGDESILCYINPYKKIDIEYQEVAIRQKLFAFTEEFVLVSKDNNDIGLISFAIPIDYKSSAWSINLIYIPIEVFDKAFKYAITKIPLISVRRITKIKFHWIEGTIDKRVLDCFAKCGFSFEGTFRKEINLENVRVYAYYINEENCKEQKPNYTENMVII
ncbi:PqqD family protein [Thermoanaerobacter thermohydrosulfuricus]|uniref:PqqD family protein n=1 Tax=Thermoanaerobacter TaxID=1754 RepID=UPI000202D84D|nr:PqqD family protein [Thermoanaerobacter indiensis]EGD50778.1 hypothetical protein TheetDRAFT_2428 [Thermoanaerobacter ethanolicus JW 200]